MPPDVRSCDEHGYFEWESCPACGRGGRSVLAGERRRRLSKFVSGALRHYPADAGIDLDDAGWTPVPALVTAVERRYDWADREALTAVVATDPKGRFERDPAGDGTGRIRAAYGHSVDVDIDAAGLLADGYDVTRRGVGVYVADRVPPAYLTGLEDRR